MIDDLVKELRFWNGGYKSDEKMAKAADRIEELENALKEILSLGEWGANPLARTIAMEALGTTYEQLKEGA
jgi:benzoyl-CoA reductase/2-hydroxyglutaryl-CoA dehydratase subunit BcrC/BadD/HgdB